MTKAEKLFNDLGYKRKDTGFYIAFKSEFNTIFFFHEDKEFVKRGKHDEDEDRINLYELEAINEFVKELGWE